MIPPCLVTNVVYWNWMYATGWTCSVGGGNAGCADSYQWDTDTYHYWWTNGCPVLEGMTNCTQAWASQPPVVITYTAITWPPKTQELGILYVWRDNGSSNQFVVNYQPQRTNPCSVAVCFYDNCSNGPYACLQYNLPVSGQ